MGPLSLALGHRKHVNLKEHIEIFVWVTLQLLSPLASQEQEVRIKVLGQIWKWGGSKYIICRGMEVGCIMVGEEDGR